MGLRAELVEIEETFRDANRAIAEIAKQLGVNSNVPFLCECSDARCRAAIRIPWIEYETVHDHDGCFVVAPGHEFLEIEQLVAEKDDYNVVEK